MPLSRSMSEGPCLPGQMPAGDLHNGDCDGLSPAVVLIERGSVSGRLARSHRLLPPPTPPSSFSHSLLSIRALFLPDSSLACMFEPSQFSPSVVQNMCDHLKGSEDGKTLFSQLENQVFIHEETWDI